MPPPVSRLESIFPKPWTNATAQVHGPLSTEALKPIWVRSSVADCSASGTSIAVRLWSIEKPTLTPGAICRPHPGNAAIGLAVVADEIALRGRRGRDSVSLSPGPQPQPIRCLRSAAAAGIVAQRVAEAVRGLVSKALQEIAAEIGDRCTGGHAGIADDREGVGLGVGAVGRCEGGVGVGGRRVEADSGRRRRARWAWADVDANASANAKAIATAITTLMPAPVFLNCEGLDEQRINIIPKKSAARAENTKSPSAGADLRPVLPERQSVTAAATARLPLVVVLLPQPATAYRRSADRHNTPAAC